MEEETDKCKIKLIEISKEEEKGIITPEKLLLSIKTKFPEEYSKFQTCDLSKLYFYYYKCESVDDTNWGCAWRSMQSVLDYQMNLNTPPQNHNLLNLYNLFMKYGSKEKLLSIYEKMKNDKKILEILTNKIFAPSENESGWAEPFISQLVLFDHGFKGDLFLVNDYPPDSYAPKEVFDKTYNFDEFKNFLKEYFNDKDKSCPIILDDSRLSACLIGVKFIYDEKGNETSLELLILDPHA